MLNLLSLKILLMEDYNATNLKIDIIAGARPNFMKIAPIIEAIKNKSNGKIKYRLIHTGQHFDEKMSETFFTELEIPKPDFNLGAGGGTQAEQTSAIMIGYEKLIKIDKYDICLVVGDVTSTMACAIVAKKEGMKVAHVEGGIRSWDLSMPEEINRLVTDSISDYFYTTSKSANENLLNSGINENRIIYVGNTMIDTLLKNLDRIRKPIFFDKYEVKIESYFVLTLHRPSNVDSANNLRILIEEIIHSAKKSPIIFPIHPRTRKVFESLNERYPQLIIVEPLGYLEFIFLIKNSKGIITDSGGITEEATVLNIPCLTLRNNTERPETVEIGTNELIGTDPENIKPAINKILAGNWKKGRVPELWDGQTSNRILSHLLSIK